MPIKIKTANAQLVHEQLSLRKQSLTRVAGAGVFPFGDGGCQGRIEHRSDVPRQVVSAK